MASAGFTLLGIMLVLASSIDPMGAPIFDPDGEFAGMVQFIVETYPDVTEVEGDYSACQWKQRSELSRAGRGLFQTGHRDI